MTAFCKKWKAGIIVTGLMSGYPYTVPEDFIRQLSVSFPDQKILVSGILADPAEGLKLNNVYPVRSADDLKSFL